MNSKNIPADLSYFRLLLVDFLRESHPQLLSDEKFIAARHQAALDIYADVIKNGGTPIAAVHWANETLFAGLHFSKYDTLKNILWNEFSTEVPEAVAPLWAIRLLPECEAVFSKYSLSDDFAYSPEYELLYTELTGTVLICLENGI
ncbi:MAG: DUF1896 domain-containing protein [Dysgonamonadaceae bacterium]|jgi:hypothetical protein|nr:DUF1896 domain-containing protein [Dysgonamonadaceae bacterium]